MIYILVKAEIINIYSLFYLRLIYLLSFKYLQHIDHICKTYSEK